MSKNYTVRALLNIQPEEPETTQVLVKRLGLKITLQELPYDKLESLRGSQDATIHYLLASAVEPNFKDATWYQEHMGCPTPADAIKRLLRPGEVSALVRRMDQLNGYAPGAVLDLDADLSGAAIGGALEDLEKN